MHNDRVILNNLFKGENISLNSLKITSDTKFLAKHASDFTSWNHGFLI